MVNKGAKKIIPGVQYLRGFAALSVVYFHAVGSLPLPALGQSYFGAAGVDLFFVISGFIMVATSEGLSPAKFVALRLYRIVPLYWLATFLTIALGAHHFHGPYFPAATIVKSLLFIPHESFEHPGHFWPVVVLGWTLSYEMFFYALFALSLALTRWRLEILTGALLALVTLGHFGKFTQAPLVVYTSPLLLEFAAGMWIGRGWLMGWAMPWWAAAASFAVGLWMLGMNDLWEILAGAALIVSASLHPRVGTWRPLQAIGDASYSIYLTHGFVLARFEGIWTRIPHTAITSALAAVVVCMSAAVVGWLSYQWVERPITRALRAHAATSRVPS